MKSLSVFSLPFALLTLVSAGSAMSQQAPAIAAPAPQSAWVVSYKSDKQPEKKAAADPTSGMVASSGNSWELKSREYTLNGKVARSVTRYTDGKTVTAFALSGIGVQENPTDTTDLIVDNFSSPWMVQGDFRRSYPGLAWILPAYYKGIVDYKGTLCHYFAEDVAPPAPTVNADVAVAAKVDIKPNLDMSKNSGMANPTKMSKGGGEAWIAVADMRPVATKTGELTATFSHTPTDSVETITVPERFLAKAQAYLDSLNPEAPSP